MGELGLERIALALAGLFAGMTPEEFAARVRDFMARGRHPTLGRPLPRTVTSRCSSSSTSSRRRDFTVFIVTGGGPSSCGRSARTSTACPPEAVVGTLIEYEYVRRDDGRPALRRTGRIHGAANEGAAKVTNIQTPARPPTDPRRRELRRGSGDARVGRGRRRADAWRCWSTTTTTSASSATSSAAQTFAEAEPITAVGGRLGWTVVSMARDWETVFGAHD